MEPSSLPSPGLDLGHGYLKLIQRVQQQNAELVNGNAQRKREDTPTKKPDQAVYIHPGEGCRRFLEEAEAIEEDTADSPVAECPPVKNISINSDNFVRMTKMDLAEVDVGRYLKEAQPYILKAIDDPTQMLSSDLEKTAGFIVSRSWEDTNYHVTAAKMCAYVVEMETAATKDLANPYLPFRTGLVKECENVLQTWQKLRNMSIDWWKSFCRFLAEVYMRVRPEGQGIPALQKAVYEAVNHLLSAHCNHNLQEVGVLVGMLQLCGSDLEADNKERMVSLMRNIRDIILSNSQSPKIRHEFLSLLVLRAGGWVLR